MKLIPANSMEEESMIMRALASLDPVQLSKLTSSVLSDSHRHLRRIATVLSSATLFSLTLDRLHSLSFPHKSLLIARHLLSSLRLLTLHRPPLSTASTTLRDLDAVLVLLLLCEFRQHHPHVLRAPVSEWRAALVAYWLEKLLTLSGLHNGAVLMPYVEAVARCWRFVGTQKSGSDDVAASPAAVLALPSVEVTAEVAAECAICKEEVAEGRDVCELPCQHLFHWACVLAWLRNSNTCPCCRFQLPTDDVYAEIQRLWGVLLKMSGSAAGTGWGSCDGECR